MPLRYDDHTTARPPLMSRINTTAILELVRASGPLSRAEIARRLKLSGSTVTRLTAELIEAGLIVPEPEPGASRGGRRPILLRFNRRAATVVGVDVGGTTTTAALADLDGHILERRSIPSLSDDGRPLAPEDVVALIAEVANHAELLGLPLRGVGIGAPSITLHEEGVVVLAPALDWANVPLATMVQSALGVPAFVENDVNLAGVGEHAYGAGQGTRNFVALLVGTGIGAGIIIDRQLYRGARDAAGEIGYLLIGRESLRQTYPGFGHLESVAGGSSIAAVTRRMLEEAGIQPGDAWPRDLARLTSRDVFAMAGRDPIASAVVDRVIDYLAIAVANIACLLNPERIVVGGGVPNGNPQVIDAIRERVTGRIPDLPEIVPAALGDDAVLIGAIALARQQTSGYAFVETIEVAERGGTAERR